MTKIKEQRLLHENSAKLEGVPLSLTLTRSCKFSHKVLSNQEEKKTFIGKQRVLSWGNTVVGFPFLVFLSFVFLFFFF